MFEGNTIAVYHVKGKTRRTLHMHMNAPLATLQLQHQSFLDSDFYSFMFYTHIRYFLHPHQCHVAQVFKAFLFFAFHWTCTTA